MIHSVAEAKKSALKGKIVFLRGSADVPMKDDLDIRDQKRIKDTSRIDSFLPTLEYLVKAGAKIVLQPGWIGRPEGVQKEFSVIPVYLYVRDKLRKKGLAKREVLLAPTELDGKVASIANNFGMIKEKIAGLAEGQVLVLENPRFDPEYNKGDESYARTLAGMVDVYVADDFAQRHRPAADIVAMAKLVHEKYAGLHLMEEIRFIGNVTKELEKGKRKPFVFILAGKKIETKPGVVSKITVALKLLDRMGKGDSILVGGAVAYTFMVAEKYIDRVMAGPEQVKKISEGDIRGIVGNSYVSWDQVHDQVMLAGRVMLKAKERGIKLVLPRDHVIASTEGTRVSADIPKTWAGVDIGPQTVREFSEAVLSAGYVVMSGPVGMFDKNAKEAGNGSFALAKVLEQATKKGVVTISAGGESTLLVNTAKVKISHASIGGGSTLEFIEKGSLPGIDALES